MGPTEIIAAAAIGLGAGFSMIVSIGAQNAFVLRQGIHGVHIGVVVLVCAVSDVVLIAAGVFGVGMLVRTAPTVVEVIRYAGIAFLICYAVLSARRALRPGALSPTSDAPRTSLTATIGTVIALTWLNPQVYLETILLLGTIANSQGPDARLWVGAGAAVASIVWFGSLGYGARLLRPVFARPLSWRILDLGTAVIMVVLAVNMAIAS